MAGVLIITTSEPKPAPAKEVVSGLEPYRDARGVERWRRRRDRNSPGELANQARFAKAAQKSRGLKNEDRVEVMRQEIAARPLPRKDYGRIYEITLAELKRAAKRAGRQNL